MRDTESGFTLIEALVSVIVAAIFILAMTELYVAQLQLSVSTAAYDQVDQLAYNNLRSYADGRKPNWFSCVYSGSPSVPQPQKLINNVTTTIPGVKGPILQSVIATAPFGCGDNIVKPILVTSSATYGGRTITHATYSTY